MSEGSMKFVKGAAILGAAALISKLVGAIYRIPYQNIAGDIGLYVYNQVYPLFTILLFLSTAGFPKAISKTVSERLVEGDVDGAKRVYHISALILSITGLIFFLVLYFGSPVIAKLAGDEQLTMPFRSISFALLIVPVMAAMRGYFQGYQNMVPTAVSQIVEQIIRVITILVLSYWFLSNGYSIYHAGSGAVFGAVTGSFAALLVLIFYWFKLKKQENLYVPKKKIVQKEPAIEVILNLTKIAIPIALGSLVLPLMQMADAFSVKNLLFWMGYDDHVSKMLKGIYDRGQPLVQFAAFVAAPLAIALLPAISEAHALKQGKLIAHRTELALRLTFLLGLPASIGLAVIAEPVNIFIYMDDQGTVALAIMAFTTIFSTLGITTDGILQGLGRVVITTRNLFMGVLFKVIFNILFIPLWGINGAALATVFAYGIATFLNIIAISRYTGVVFGLRNFIVKPFVAVLVMAIAVLLVKRGSSFLLSAMMDENRLYYGFIVMISVIIATVVYGAMLLLTGVIRERDLDAVPRLNKLKPLLKGLGLLRYS